MKDALIYARPKSLEGGDGLVNLADYDSIEELMDQLLVIHPLLSENAPKCPKCGGDTFLDDTSPKLWCCEKGCLTESLWLDEVDLGLIYEIDTQSEGAKLLKDFGYIKDFELHEDVFSFIELHNDLERDGKDDALRAYMHNCHFKAGSDDPSTLGNNFQEDYIGTSPSFDTHSVHEWFGQWMIDNGMANIPDGMEGNVDLASFAEDYFTGGSYFHSDGHIFQSR